METVNIFAFVVAFRALQSCDTAIILPRGVTHMLSALSWEIRLHRPHPTPFQEEQA